MTDFNVILDNLSTAEDATCLTEITTDNVVDFLQIVNSRGCNALHIAFVGDNVVALQHLLNLLPGKNLSALSA